MKHRWIAVLLALCLGIGTILPASAATQYNDSIDVDGIFQAAYAFFAGYEGQYDSVTPKDSNSLSIGRLQWHGLRARGLLKLIISKNPSKITPMLSSALYSDIMNKSDSYWNTRCLTSAEATQVKAVLGTPEGMQAQDEQAYIDICSYIEAGWKAGFRSNATLFYYCSVLNQYGVGGAAKWLGYVRATMGITANDTVSSLEALHTAVRNTSASTVRNYLNAREKVYKYLKNLSWNLNGPDAPVSYPSSIFTDVPKDAWFREAVDYAVSHNLFAGTSATTFSPNVGMTRAMLVTVLYRMAGSHPAQGTTTFKDVKPNSYYATPVLWAATYRIVSGVSADRFEPDTVITRQQVAAVLYKYHTVYLGKNANLNGSLSSFADAGQVSDYAKEAMLWAVNTGVITGTVSGGKTYLNPNAEASRAQVAMILMQYLKNCG